MTDLQSGTYVSSRDKVVTYWPAPDKDGPGDELWYDKYDDQGRSLGRERVKDDQGNVVYTYPAPDGFENRRSYDGSDNFVKLAQNGRDVYRTPNGEAVSIKPGQAIVEHADGVIEVLEDEYARYLFAKAHEQVSGADATPKKATPATVVPPKK